MTSIQYKMYFRKVCCAACSGISDMHQRNLNATTDAAYYKFNVVSKKAACFTLAESAVSPSCSSPAIHFETLQTCSLAHCVYCILSDQ